VESAVLDFSQYDKRLSVDDEMTVKLKPGWLKRQVNNAKKDVARWPAWMRRYLSPITRKKE
jgi:hypothetical protein